MIICSMPGCQTTAGCQCGRTQVFDAQSELAALSAKLAEAERERGEAVTIAKRVTEVMETWFDGEHPVRRFEARVAELEKALAEGNEWRWVGPALKQQLDGMTLREAEKASGVSKSALSRITRGKPVTLDNFFAVKQWLTAHAFVEKHRRDG